MTLMSDPAFQGYTFEKQIDAGNASVMVIRNETGEGSMRCLEAFPGITLSYNSLRMKTCYQQVAPMEGFLSLNYCREGCFQVTLKNGKAYLLGEGDLVINDPGRSMIVDSQCPTGVFEGFTIILEISKVAGWMKENAPCADVSWLNGDICKRLAEPVTIIANKTDILHMAEGFYSSSAENNRSFRIIKVLEVLELMSEYIGKSKPVEYFSLPIVKATEAVYSYIQQNPAEKTTVGVLCGMFGISKTSLQGCFKSMYGMTPANFIRDRRIRHAAKLLVSRRDMSIGEIASEVGYDNASKFAAAFHAVMNEQPLEYRKKQKHTWQNGAKES